MRDEQALCLLVSIVESRRNSKKGDVLYKNGMAEHTPNKKNDMAGANSKDGRAREQYTPEGKNTMARRPPHGRKRGDAQ